MIYRVVAKGDCGSFHVMFEGGELTDDYFMPMEVAEYIKRTTEEFDRAKVFVSKGLPKLGPGDLAPRRGQQEYLLFVKEDGRWRSWAQLTEPSGAT